MPFDIQQFSMNPAGPANVNVPTHEITGQILDLSQTPPTVVADFTGANAIQFPSVLGTLSQEQQAEIMELVGQRILQMRGGVE